MRNSSDIEHPFGFDSPAKIYCIGIKTGLAVAIELAEESATLEELIDKLKARIQ